MARCPTSVDLEILVAGSCDPQREADILRHAESCPECSDWIREAREDEDVASEVRRALAADGGELHEHTAPTGLARYRVGRRIGAGGMGVVWEAEQENPRRKVALKVLRGGLTNDQQRARFDFEAQLLGRLDHQGIARILEAGVFTVDGEERPFFAMELVTGRPLDVWCREESPGIRTRLGRFIDICDAVAHAHQRGIIHRDLKPANVLVTEKGAVKVLDFGVACAVDREDEDWEALTLEGQIVGTLAYMSPEQLGGDALEIDTRSDVFSLGVVLFEMLAGRRPVDVSGLPLADAVERLRKSEAPRLGTVLQRADRDLETIVSTAMAVERGRRYTSVEALAADVRRWLVHEPIAARPVSTTYLVQRFAQRNRGFLMAVAAVLTALVVGLFTTTAQARRARAAERVAEDRSDKLVDESERLAATVGFLTDLLGTNNPAATTRGAQYTVREALDHAAGKLAGGEVDDPRIEAPLRVVLGNAFAALGLHDIAVVHLERAVDLHRTHAALTSTLPRPIHDLATVLWSSGDPDRAIELWTEAESLYREIGDPGDEKRRATTLGNLSVALIYAGQLDMAEDMAREALEIHRGELRDSNHTVANDLNYVASIAWRRGDGDEAEDLLRQALAAHEASDEPRALYTTYSQVALADVLRNRGELDEAEELLYLAREIVVELFGEDHADIAEIDRALGRVEAAR